jgi:hypothetical protein
MIAPFKEDMQWREESDVAAFGEYIRCIRGVKLSPGFSSPFWPLTPMARYGRLSGIRDIRGIRG